MHSAIKDKVVLTIHGGETGSLRLLPCPLITSVDATVVSAYHGIGWKLSGRKCPPIRTATKGFQNVFQRRNHGLSERIGRDILDASESMK